MLSETVRYLADVLNSKYTRLLISISTAESRLIVLAINSLPHNLE